MTPDFGQRVMAAAGVARYGGCCRCGHLVSAHPLQVSGACESFHVGYPDPLTPEGFWALWDGLEALGWRVRITAHYAMPAYTCSLFSYTAEGFPDRSISLDRTNRAAALLEAAAQALEVKP